MTVFLNLESTLLTDYCKYLFPPDKNDEICQVKGNSTFGELLISHVRTSGTPVPKPAGDHVICFRLPKNNTTQSLNYKFLYFSQGDQLRLNAGLKALFDIDFYSYVLRAEGLGFQRKDIVDSFIVSRKLFNCDPEDALHKRIYRRESCKRKEVFKKLLRKVYYMNEAIDASGINTQEK